MEISFAWMGLKGQRKKYEFFNKENLLQSAIKHFIAREVYNLEL